MKVVGYVRVSTMGQAENGVSLDAQRAKIEAWAKANDAELLHIYTDAGISGCRGDRPGLLKALDQVCKEHAALIVYSLSRFSRSTKGTLEMADRLDKAGADLVSLSERIDTTTAAGKMIFRMMAVLNEFERDQISDRTTAALAYKRHNGEKTGGICPYGFDAHNGMLSPNAAERAVINKIHKLRERGHTYSGIARELNQLGYRTKTGRTWYPQTVKNVIFARRAA